VQAGIVLTPPEGDAMKYAIQLEFPASNNIVEYEGLVNGLQLAKDLGIQRLLIRVDSHWWPDKYKKSMIAILT
jgi:ribonuclease HI